MRATLFSTTVLATALLLAGCGGDDSPTSTPTTSSSGATTSPTAGGSESSSPAPTVAPATGPLLDGEVSTVNAPQGWKVRDNGMPYSKNAENPAGGGQQSMLLLEGPWPGGADPLDEMAKRAQDNFDRKPRRLPDVTLDGETAYHLAGVSTGVRTDEVGLASHDKWIQLSILTQGLSAAQRDELVASVVASFKWKG